MGKKYKWKEEILLQLRQNFEDRLKKVRPDLTVLEYKAGGGNTGRAYVKVACSHGHVWEVQNAQKLLKLKKIENQCPYCANLIKPLEGNSVGELRPDLIKYFDIQENAFKYLCGSDHREGMHCPICGYQKEYSMYTLTRKGFSCPNCEFDGISTPNKMIRSVLKQFKDDLTYLKFEDSPDWLSPQSLDAHFIINNIDVCVEMQGPQHYEKPFYWTQEQFLRQVERDKMKRKLCKENNCIEIEIKSVTSDYSKLKQEIEQSELKNYLNLEKVDWDKVFSEVGEKLLETIIGLYKSGYNQKQIKQELNICYPTVLKYLDIAVKIGEIDFIKRPIKKKVTIINEKTKERKNFISLKEATQYIQEEYGFDINSQTISKHCEKREAQVLYQGILKFYWWNE